MGLLSDLERLDFIKHGFRVLLIGAGGASRGVLLPLLSLDCAVTIVNRTFSRAHELATLFAHTGSVRALDIEALNGQVFDLIINATSSGIEGEVPAIPVSLINTHVYCYDMFYQKGCTPFYVGVSNMVLKDVLMGWECWWHRLHTQYYCGTVFYRKLPL